MVTSGPRRAVFLDRDGVLNRPMLRDGNPLPPATVELQPPVEVRGTGRCDGFWNARVDLEWTAAATPPAGIEI